MCGLFSLQDAQESFNIKIEAPKTPTTPVTGSLQTPPPRAGIGDTWLEIDESFSEQLVSIEEGEGEKIADDGSSDSLRSQRGSRGSVGGYRWAPSQNIHFCRCMLAPSA